MKKSDFKISETKCYTKKRKKGTERNSQHFKSPIICFKGLVKSRQCSGKKHWNKLKNRTNVRGDRSTKAKVF